MSGYTCKLDFFHEAILMLKITQSSFSPSNVKENVSKDYIYGFQKKLQTF